MNLLLDTHTFIWLNVSPELLSEKALSAGESPENRLYFSLISAWEMQIKTQLGKLILPVHGMRCCSANKTIMSY